MSCLHSPTTMDSLDWCILQYPARPSLKPPQRLSNQAVIHFFFYMNRTIQLTGFDTVLCMGYSFVFISFSPITKADQAHPLPHLTVCLVDWTVVFLVWLVDCLIVWLTVEEFTTRWPLWIPVYWDVTCDLILCAEGREMKLIAQLLSNHSLSLT